MGVNSIVPAWDAFVRDVVAYRLGGEPILGAAFATPPLGSGAVRSLVTAAVGSGYFIVLTAYHVVLIEVHAPMGRPSKVVRSNREIVWSDIGGVVQRQSILMIALSSGEILELVVLKEPLVSGQGELAGQLVARFGQTELALALGHVARRNQIIVGVFSLIALVILVGYIACDLTHP